MHVGSDVMFLPSLLAHGTSADFSEGHIAYAITIVVLLVSQVIIAAAYLVNRSRSNRAERVLRAGETQFGRMADEAPVMLWVVDEQGKCVFVNRRWLDFTGRTLEQDLGDGWADRLYPEDRENALRSLHEASRARKPWECEYRLLRHDGEYRWILDRGVPLYETDGSYAGLIGSCIDITERKLARDALLESEARFRAIAENSGLGILQITPDRRVIYANPAAAELLEMDNGDGACAALVGQQMDRFYAPESVDIVLEHLRMRSEGIASVYEAVLVGARGTRRSVIIAGAPVLLADGRFHSMIATITDISERKRMEQALKESNDLLEQRIAERTAALRESEERFQRLADSASEGIAIHADGRILAANQALADILGYPRDELIGGARLEQAVPAIGKMTACGEETVVLEATGIRKDGSTFPIELRGKWIPYDGRMVRVVAVRDLTAQQQMQQAENRHREEMAHVLRQVMLGELASGLAHELNQPLTAIANYAGACLRRVGRAGISREDLIETLSQVASQSERAGQIIRRMRAFVRRGEPHRTSAEVNHMVRESIRFMQTEFTENKIALELCLANEPIHVMADHIQIEQVILNLLRNACDAVQGMEESRRQVMVTTACDGRSAVIRVTDRGLGVPDEMVTKIFEPFSTTKPQGMGLGLSISRGIVEAHGGKLTYEPNPEGGSHFMLTLPV